MKKYRARGRSKPDCHDGSREGRLEYGNQLLRSLLDSEAATDPDVAGTEIHKGAFAYRSLRDIAELLDVFAGWAVDHWLGLAITGDAMPRIPVGQGKKIEYSPKTKKALAAAKSHDAEAMGSGLWTDPLPLNDGATQRLAVYNLLSPMLLQMFPRETQLKIREAFAWLDEGYTGAFFDTPRRGIRFETNMLRLKALCCMEYDAALRGYGKKASIIMDIAEAFGISEHAVRKWPVTVAKYDKIDSQTIESALAHAKAVGTRVREIEQTHPGYKVDARTDAAYGRAAMKAAGQRFQAIGPRSKKKIS